MNPRTVRPASYRAPREWRRLTHQTDLDVYAALTGTRLVLMPAKGTPPVPARSGENARRRWGEWCGRNRADALALTLRLKEGVIPWLRPRYEAVRDQVKRRAAEGWERLQS